VSNLVSSIYSQPNLIQNRKTSGNKITGIWSSTKPVSISKNDKNDPYDKSQLPMKITIG
jgi:hypothetical protein